MNYLSDIKGIGPSTIKKLNTLKINTISDLVEYYPYRFNYLEITNLDETLDYICVEGIIESAPTIFFIRKNLNKMSFRVNTNNKVLNVTIFNRVYLKNKLNIGDTITIIGKYDKLHNSIVAKDIKFEKIIGTKIEPIYHIINGLKNKELNKYIMESLKDIDIENYIPEEYISKYNLLSKIEAVKEIHNPTNKKKLNYAISTLKYEELFLFMLKINYLKNKLNERKGIIKNFDKTIVSEFIKKLPFELTCDQLKCIDEIRCDLNSERRMNRLVIGDVGSGKTIISFIAIYMNYLSGYQSSLLAPTEILATQHYQNALKIFKNTNIKIALLTGKTKQSEKKLIYKKLENNEIDLIIGTHALFTNEVKYNNLGLIITDEQHRFGVNQRSNMHKKGIYPDIIYMSATPIPRTYALTLYGDMDISSIHTLPNGRKDIITYVKSENEIKDVLELMYSELKKGHQIYVVCPLIENEEENDTHAVLDIKEKMNKAFGKLYNIDILHGKMKNNEKENIMNKFINNEIQILISTTVIEVGVDNKNATVMVVFDSYRFGLAALHQLRGRVGRNNLQSYCVLISDRETERLNILKEVQDGFKISEEDFRLRGSGDLFGERQSGDMSFKLANIKNDFNILLKAKIDSEEFLNSIEIYDKNKWIEYLHNTVNQD